MIKKDFHIVPSWISKLFNDEFKQAEAVQAAFNRLDQIMHKPPEIDLKRRRYDIHVDYFAGAPKDERFQAIDLNEYEAAPDSEGVSTCMGRGATREEAIKDLVSQVAEFDAQEPAPKPRTRIVNLGNPNEPPESIDEPRDREDDE